MKLNQNFCSRTALISRNKPKNQGATLSGGQRARINLARCLYRDADIYLIDDPFAAVDPSVAKKISNGLVKYLKDKTKVIVTHQSEYLPEADGFYVIKEGKVSKLDHAENDEPEVEAAVSPSEVKLIESKVEVSARLSDSFSALPKFIFYIYSIFLTNQTTCFSKDKTDGKRRAWWYWRKNLPNLLFTGYTDYCSFWLYFVRIGCCFCHFLL